VAARKTIRDFQHVPSNVSDTESANRPKMSAFVKMYRNQGNIYMAHRTTGHNTMKYRKVSLKSDMLQKSPISQEPYLQTSDRHQTYTHIHMPLDMRTYLYTCIHVYRQTDRQTDTGLTIVSTYSNKQKSQIYLSILPDHFVGFETGGLNGKG